MTDVLCPGVGSFPSLPACLCLHHRHPNPPPPSPRVNPSHTFRMPLTSYLFRYDRGAYWLAQPGTPSRLTLLAAWFYTLSSRGYLTRLVGRWLYSPTTIFALLQLATPGQSPLSLF